MLSCYVLSRLLLTFSKVVASLNLCENPSSFFRPVLRKVGCFAKRQQRPLFLLCTYLLANTEHVSVTQCLGFRDQILFTVSVELWKCQRSSSKYFSVFNKQKESLTWNEARVNGFLDQTLSFVYRWWLKIQCSHDISKMDLVRPVRTVQRSELSIQN